MSRLIIACLGLSFVSVARSLEPAGSNEEWTILYAGELLASPDQAPRQDQTIIVKNGKVDQIRSGFVDASALDTGGRAPMIVDLRDRFVLPGLIDVHTHITHDPSPGAKLKQVIENDADLALSASVYARQTLEAGFTAIRDLGAPGYAVFALRNAINQGKVPGPRILAGGETISVSGGHGDVHGYREDLLGVLASGGICDGADDCRRVVREQIKRGADVIKVMVTGGASSAVATGTGVQLTEAELRAIVETAHGLGRKVAAHAHGAEGIKAALLAGADSIEHGTWADRDPEIFELFKRTGAYLSPTAYLIEYVGDTKEKIRNGPWGFQPPEVLEKVFQIVLPQQPRVMLKAAHQAGVKVALGTDSGVYPHGDNARELIEYVRIGMTESEAIRTATVNAAALLDLSDEIGTIEPGKSADIIATSKSPLDDIAELTRVTFVMKGGQVFKQTEGSMSLTDR